MWKLRLFHLYITAGRTDNNEQDRPYPLYSTQFNLIMTIIHSHHHYNGTWGTYIRFTILNKMFTKYDKYTAYLQTSVP